MRLSMVALTCLVLLAACGESDQAGQSAEAQYAAAPPAPEMDAMMQPGEPVAMGGEGASRGFAFGAGAKQLQQPQSGESYVYDHHLVVSMASEHIKARFERARDTCQNDPALNCKVMSASFRLIGEPHAPLPVANLTVALPHQGVVLFERSVLQPLPGEDSGDILVKARTTNAQNVTNQVKDIESRLAQLRSYRERMTDLSKRGGAKTDDLIKIESEISRTQAEIEQIEGQARDLAERIARENLSISFEAQSTVADAFQPVRDVWQNSLRLMGESFAAVVALIVAIVPWVPVLLIALFGLRWLLRRLRRAP